MLSKQYTPRANDGVENEMPVGSLHRARTHRSSIYSSPLGTDEDPGVSLVDLQRLEELADEAAKSNDPAKLRTMLRRSWSIGGHSEQGEFTSREKDRREGGETKVKQGLERARFSPLLLAFLSSQADCLLSSTRLLQPTSTPSTA